MIKKQLLLSLLWMTLVTTSVVASHYTRTGHLMLDNPHLVFPLIAVGSLAVGFFMGRKR
jgi:hypothetical protein